MTHTELVGIVTQYMPTCMGILLAGSQKSNSVLTKTTDIDIITLDTSFSHAQNFSIVHNNYKFDITVLPLTDIENVIQSESNEGKAGVLHMLKHAVVLKDSLGVATLLQQKANTLVNRIGGKVFAAFGQQLTCLARNIKYFSKPLGPVHKDVLLCDTVSIITDLESIKTTNWLSRQHKFSLLEEGNSNSICKELMGLYHQATISHNIEPVGNFADYYYRIAEKSIIYPVTSNTRLLVDLDYPDFSIPHFVASVLPTIREIDEENNSFLYFYLSPRQYHKTYQHRITLVFRIKDQIHASDLLKKIDIYIQQIFDKGHRYGIIYQDNDQANPASFAWLEKLRIAVNDFIIAELEAGRFTPVLVIYNAISISSYIANTLRLSTPDCIKATSFLSQRFLLTPEEQKQSKGFEHLGKMQAEKFQHGFSFYQQHSRGILDYCNQGALLALKNDNNTSKNYTGLIKAIDEILDNEDYFKGKEENLSYVALAKGNCEDLDSVYKFMTLINEILQYICLNEQEKYITLLAFSKGIGELKTGS